MVNQFNLFPNEDFCTTGFDSPKKESCLPQQAAGCHRRFCSRCAVAARPPLALCPAQTLSLPRGGGCCLGLAGCAGWNCLARRKAGGGCGGQASVGYADMIRFDREACILLYSFTHSSCLPSHQPHRNSVIYYYFYSFTPHSCHPIIPNRNRNRSPLLPKLQQQQQQP